jgi:hypothetical protein
MTIVRSSGSPTAKGPRLPVVAIAASLCVFAVFETLNFSGFCYSSRRFLSGSQLMDIAVQANLARYDASQ